MKGFRARRTDPFSLCNAGKSPILTRSIPPVGVVGSQSANTVSTDCRPRKVENAVPNTKCLRNLRRAKAPSFACCGLNSFMIRLIAPILLQLSIRASANAFVPSRILRATTSCSSCHPGKSHLSRKADIDTDIVDTPPAPVVSRNVHGRDSKAACTVQEAVIAHGSCTRSIR